MANGDADHKDIWLEINNLRNQVTELATRMQAQTTPKEYNELNMRLTELSVNLKMLGDLRETIATKQDVEWLKGFFWKSMGVMATIEGGIILSLLAHILVK